MSETMYIGKGGITTNENKARIFKNSKEARRLLERITEKAPLLVITALEVRRDGKFKAKVIIDDVVHAKYRDNDKIDIVWTHSSVAGPYDSSSREFESYDEAIEWISKEIERIKEFRKKVLENREKEFRKSIILI